MITTMRVVDMPSTANEPNTLEAQVGATVPFVSSIAPPMTVQGRAAKDPIRPNASTQHQSTLLLPHAPSRNRKDAAQISDAATVVTILSATQIPVSIVT